MLNYLIMKVLIIVMCTKREVLHIEAMKIMRSIDEKSSKFIVTHPK